MTFRDGRSPHVTHLPNAFDGVAKPPANATRGGPALTCPATYLCDTMKQNLTKAAAEAPQGKCWPTKRQREPEQPRRTTSFLFPPRGKPSGRPRGRPGGKPGGPKPKLKFAPVPDSTATMRLNRYIAQAGVCSRREADVMIGAGVVSVNNKVITELRIQGGPHQGPCSRRRRHHPSGDHAVRVGEQAQELFGHRERPEWTAQRG